MLTLKNKHGNPRPPQTQLTLRNKHGNFRPPQTQHDEQQGVRYMVNGSL
jgi:hypothetical protein